MNKGFYKKISLMVVSIFLMAVLPGEVFASVGVTIIRPESKGTSAVVVELAAMKPFAVDMETIDPNFPNNGRVTFSGIYIDRLLRLANAPVDQGATVVGRDQYVGYIPLEKGIGKRVILAFAMNGHPISGLEGGPLKIMYDSSEGVHGSGYTWYVETILTGTLEDPGLMVSADGRQKVLFSEQLISMARDIDLARVSIPSGSRQGFLGPKLVPSKTRVTGVDLNTLLSFLEIRPDAKITLFPVAGPELILARSLLDYPITLVCTMDGEALHPVFGGPFSLQFPVEDYPEIGDLLPESGAFFFLKQIVAH